jgi:hypothetical protein
MNGRFSMKYRKLRIAWSVGWGLLCLLLIALWVRSYSRADALVRERTSTRTETGIASNYGAIVLGRRIVPAPPRPPGTIPIRWDYLTDDARRLKHDFGWRANGGDIRIGFPTGLPVLLASGLAFAPWLRCRFSLRTLLIASTVVAVVLGLAVMLPRRS